jgi:hypothetical protein
MHSQTKRRNMERIKQLLKRMSVDGKLAMNIVCQNTASQIRGDGNGAAPSSAQEFDD